MKVAIISDIHDNVWNLEAAFEEIQRSEVLICCGDLCSPFIVDLLAEGFSNRPIHIVFGNNDGDPYRITSNASKYKDNVKLHGEFADLSLGGKHFAVNHYPHIASNIATSGKYDVVCYGHNHSYKVERIGKILMINPGAIMGYDGVNKKDIPSTFIIYDTDSDKWTGYEVTISGDVSARARSVILLGERLEL